MRAISDYLTILHLDLITHFMYNCQLTVFKMFLNVDKMLFNDVLLL